MIQPRPYLADLAAYGVENRVVAPGKRLIPLDVNESLRPPSPAVAEAVARAVTVAHRYPDSDWIALREAIAEIHGLEIDTLLCGAGSLELIGLLMRAFAGLGDEVLATQYAYAYFRSATRIAGAAYVAAAEAEMTVSVDPILAAVTQATRIVCVANPGNPTGTVIPAAEIRRLRDGLGDHILLVIDQAYGEFVDTQEGPLFDLVARGDTVVLRTFSKAYGLAGMRIGWGVFPPPIAAEVRKLQPPGPVSGAAQAAAVAAMQDQSYMRETVAQTVAERTRFEERLSQTGIDHLPSQTNFVLARFGHPEEATTADRALRAEGVLTRGMGFYGLPECLRITVGTAEDMYLTADTLIRCLREETRS
ncbi:MAG: histidinol-phosphate transaminase [Pseudomonadota bacterium]